MRDEILANQQVQEWNNFRHLYKASSPCEAQTHISMKSTMSSFVLDLRYSWWSTPFLWIIDCIIKYTDTPLTSETQNNYGCIMQAIIVFHVKVKNERFTAAGSRCRQNLKYESLTTSFGRLRQKIAPKACRTCSTTIFPHSTNQNRRYVALPLPLPSSFLKLPFIGFDFASPFRWFSWRMSVSVFWATKIKKQT